MSPQYSGRFHETFPATAGLLLVIVGFFVLEFLLDSKLADPLEGGGPSLMTVGAESAEHLGATRAYLVVEERQLWRLVAAVFLHFGVIHLAFNLWVLLDLGRVCEPMLGTERFLTIFVATGIISSLAGVGYRYLDVLVLNAPRGVLAGGSVGASGALCGLIGMLLAFSLRHRERELRNHIVRWIIYIVLLSLLAEGAIGGLRIDHVGHAAGILSGMAFGWFVPRYTSSAVARRWRVPSWIAMAVCIVALGFSIWSMFEKLANPD